jgi:outer membrane protein OmpA-like peptidoglycan-associated protein
MAGVQPQKINHMSRIIFFILLIFSLTHGHAQMYPYNWRIGLSAGITNYYGDLSPYRINSISDIKGIKKLYEYNPHYYDGPSFMFSIERRLSPTLGLSLSAGKYNFSMSDRFIKPDGTLKYDTPKFSRALNFRTEVNDIGLALVFRTDNHRFLKRDAFLAPYFSVGFGYMWFSTKADLYDENGNPYDYSQPGKINDYKFETDVQQLLTEDVNYRNKEFYANLGLGLRFRLSYQFELFVHSEFKRAFSDHLDDVSGDYPLEYTGSEQQYASNPSGLPVTQDNRKRGSENKYDTYIYHGAGLRFSFAQRDITFNAPKVHTHGTVTFDESFASVFDPILMPKVDSTIPAGQPQETMIDKRVFINYNIINPEDTAFKMNVLRRLFESERLNSILQKEIVLRSLSDSLSESERELQMIDQEIELTRNDTLIPDSIRNARIEALSALRQDFNLQSDSLARESELLRTELTDLEKLEFADSLYLPMRDTMRYTRIMEPGLLTGEPEKGLWALLPEYADTTQPAVQKDEGLATDTVALPVMTEEQLRDEVNEFKLEMLKAQQWRDSVMIEFMAGSRQIVPAESKTLPVTEETPPAPVQSATTPAAQQPQRAVPATGTISQPASPGLSGFESQLSDLSQQITRQNAILTALIAAQAVTAIGSGDKKQDENGFGAEMILVYQMELENQDRTIQALQLEIDSLRGMAYRQDTVFRVDTIMTVDTITEKIVKEIEVKGDPIKVLSNKEEIYFAINSAKVTEGNLIKIRKVADLLKLDSTINVRLAGFADNTGDADYNLELSKRRTQSVRENLISAGIRPDRIIVDVGGQIVRGPARRSNDQDRKVEILIE